MLSELTQSYQAISWLTAMGLSCLSRSLSSGL